MKSQVQLVGRRWGTHLLETARAAELVGYLVGQLHNATPAPMALAMSAAGWGAFASYRLLLKAGQESV